MAETEKEDRDEETSLAMIMIEDDAQMKEFCLFGGPGTRRNPILKPGRNQCDQQLPNEIVIVGYSKYSEIQ